MTQQDRGDQQDYNSPVQQSLPQPQQYMRSSDPTASILHAGPGSGHAAPQSLVQQHHQQQQQQHQQQQQQTVPAHHHAAATTASMMMDPSQMGGHHPDPHSAHHSHARMDPGQPQHYGPPPGPVMAPLYHQHMQATQPPTQHQTHISTGSKRPRPDDLDLHAPTGPLGSLDHAQLTGMHPHTHPHHVSMTGYGPATTAAGHGHVPAHTQHHHHSQQHHHRLPHSEPVPKLMRRDDPVGMMASSSSVVGQEGMPEPAKRPKGPKLKFTTDDDQLLIELKEKKNLTWKQIADFFPGRSSGTLQVRYCTKLKAKTKQWNRDMVSARQPPVKYPFFFFHPPTNYSAQLKKKQR